MARFDTTYQTRMHEPFQRSRDRTIAALYQCCRHTPVDEWDEEQRLADKAAEKLCTCGRFAAVYHDPNSGQLVKSQARCKHRLCPYCNKIRSVQLEKQLSEHLHKLNSPRMLTLTPEHSDKPLKEQVDDLYAAFKRLRNSQAYQAKITGGVAVLEIKWSHDDGRWHPHLHVLVDGRYWAQQEISQAWKKASNGAYIVHIKMIHDRSKAGHYLSKYVAKVGDVEGVPLEKLPELNHALHGRRMVQTSGSLYGTTNKKKEPKRDQPLEYVAPIGPLVNAAKRGETKACGVLAQVLKAFKHRCPVGADRLDGEALDQCREAVMQLRDWWSTQTTDYHNDTTDKPPNPPDKRRPHHGTQRLWQESGPEPSALADGR